MKPIKYNPYATLYEELEQRKRSDLYPFGQPYVLSQTHLTEPKLVDEVCSVLETSETDKHQRSRQDWEIAVATILEIDALTLPPTISVRDLNLELWLGIRACLHESSLYHEQERLVNAAWQTIHPLVQQVCAFCLMDGADLTETMLIVAEMLDRVDHAYSLCPNIAFFGAILDPALRDTFSKRCDALHSWIHINKAVQCLQRELSSMPSLMVDGNKLSEVYAHICQGVQRFMTRTDELVRTTHEAYNHFSDCLTEMNLPEHDIFTVVTSPCQQMCQFMQQLFAYDLESTAETNYLGLLTLEQSIDVVKLACTVRRWYAEALNLNSCTHHSPHPFFDVAQLDAIIDIATQKTALLFGRWLTSAPMLDRDGFSLLGPIWDLFSEVAMSIWNGSAVVAREACGIVEVLAKHVSLQIEAELSEMERTAMASKQHYSSRHGLSEAEVIRNAHQFIDRMDVEVVLLLLFSKQLLTVTCNTVDYLLLTPSARPLIQALFATGHVLIQPTDLCLSRSSQLTSHVLVFAPATALRRGPLDVSKFISPTYGFCTTNIDDTEAIADVAGDRDASYLLVVSVEQDDNIEWDGPCIAADLFADDWGIPTGSARLVTDLTRTPLGASKRAFSSVVEAGVVSPHTLPPHTAPIVSPSPRQIHALSPAIQTTVTRILDTISNLAEFVAGSTERMRDWAGDRGLHVGRETLLTCWYQSLASFTDFRKGMTQDLLRRFDESMAVISSSWLTFISTKQSRTNFVLSPFRAAHGALAFSAACLTVSTWRQHYPDQWQVLQSAMATCVIHLNSINLAARSRPVQSMSQEVLSAAHIIKDIRAAIAKAGEFTSGGIELEPVATRREASQQRTEMAIHYLDEQINLRHQRGRLVNVEPDNAPLISLASRGVFIPRQQGRLLGSGAYGSVYLAQVLDSDVLIAVKEVKLPGIVDQTRIYARIKVELSVLQELRHCNIVEYYGFEVHNHKICIFEEYCSGGSLKQRLTVGRIRDETVIQKYTRDLLAGLSYLHSRGVVHHDIKPDNILFDGEGTIKYVDFGASQILADRQRTMELARSAMDDTPSDSASTIRAESFRSDSTLRGTPMYMSPEVVSGGSASGRSAVDIWSLGCVVLEMSTGRKPWEHLPNDWAIILHLGLAKEHPPLPSAYELNQEGVQFIQRCLIVDPTGRPTASDLMGHAWLEEQPVSTDMQKQVHDVIE